MALGAMLDAGLPLDDLKGALGSLALGDARPRRPRPARRRLGDEVQRPRAPPPRHEHPRSTQHDHTSTEHQHRHPHQSPSRTFIRHRSLPEIFALIDGSALYAAGPRAGEGDVPAAGEAEAAIHQMPVEQVHLHEVGALDSIIDIVGIVFAMEWSGADRIVCSPLNVGGGMVHSAHGVFPVPAPATVRLLGDAPVYSGTVQKELVTPTGALIATDLRDVVRADAGDVGRARRLRRGRPRRPGDAERAARADRPRRGRSAGEPSASP